jgi:hypothetical protein
MNTYRVRLTSSSGQRLEVVDFQCENDQVAHDMVSHHIQTNQTAEIWRGTRLISRVAGRIYSRAQRLVH